LSKLKGAQTFAEGSISDEIAGIMNNPNVRTFKSDYFTCVYFDPNMINSGLFPQIEALFNSYLSDHFPEYRPPTLL
jgi:hypothetical protein